MSGSVTLRNVVTPSAPRFCEASSMWGSICFRTAMPFWMPTGT